MGRRAFLCVAAWGLALAACGDDTGNGSGAVATSESPSTSSEVTPDDTVSTQSLDFVDDSGYEFVVAAPMPSVSMTVPPDAPIGAAGLELIADVTVENATPSRNAPRPALLFQVFRPVGTVQCGHDERSIGNGGYCSVVFRQLDWFLLSEGVGAEPLAVDASEFVRFNGSTTVSGLSDHRLAFVPEGADYDDGYAALVVRTVDGLSLGGGELLTFSLGDDEFPAELLADLADR